MDAERVRLAWQKFTDKMRILRARQSAILRRFEAKAGKDKIDDIRRHIEGL